MSLQTLGLITARGGSKGVPRKNLKPLAGKPLIVWSIEAALKAERLSSVVVSTEDEEIAAVARAAGAKVPFMRPAELAQDDTPGIAPVLHALQMLPQFDAVLLMQPTTPLRRAADIDACLALAEARQANAVVSVCPADTHPHWTYRIGADQHLAPMFEGRAATRRQDLPPAYALNGALYYARATWLQRTRSMFSDETVAYVMPPERSVDLDTPLDWRLAELLLSEEA